MAWNNKAKRIQFEQKQKLLADEYRSLGMSEQAIHDMYEFDLSVLRSDRRFYSHNQSIENLKAFEGGESVNREFLYQLIPNTLAVSDDDLCLHSSDWWVEEIADESLAKAVKSLSMEQIHLLTLYVFEQMTEKELASVYGIAQQNISKKINKIKKILENRV